MDDFLTRIARKALGTAPVVQPLTGSRYAPATDLSLPAISPSADRQPAEQTFGRDSQAAEGPSSANVRQIIRPAPSGDAVEAGMSFEESALPTEPHRQIRSHKESKEEALVRSGESTQTRADSLAQGLERSSTLIVGESSSANAEVEIPAAQTDDVRVATRRVKSVINSEPVVPAKDDSFDLSKVSSHREQTENQTVVSLARPGPTIEAKPPSRSERGSVNTPLIAPHGEKRLKANDSDSDVSTPFTAPSSPEAIDHEDAGQRRSAPLITPLRSETVDREVPSRAVERQRSTALKSEAVDREGPQLTDEKRSATLTVSSGSEAIDRKNFSRADASLVDQPIVRSVDQRLLSPKDVGDVHPASEKIIRVSIGRIEVRAVLPPSQPVESHDSPAPKLSLDEFLRQQNGRRR